MKRGPRYRAVRVAAPLLCLLASASGSTRADETFVCADGSSVTVDDDNRSAMQDHPCVKAWFAADRPRREAQAGDRAEKSGTPPVLRRSTVNGSAALRDLKQRPGYLAWSRARALRTRPVDRTNGTA